TSRTSRVPGITRNAKIAPYKSCIGCYKGDTTTAVVSLGTSEWHIAALKHLTDMPLDEASRTFAQLAAELGCPPGNVPGGRFALTTRLCRACAEKTDTHVFEERAIKAGEPVGVYASDPEYDNDDDV